MSDRAVYLLAVVTGLGAVVEELALGLGFSVEAEWLQAATAASAATANVWAKVVVFTG